MASNGKAANPLGRPKLTTGIEAIDRRLEGGFAPGSIVSLVSPPAAQSHAILQEIMKERPTEYLTTLRSKAAIEKDIGHLIKDGVSVNIREVGEAVNNGGRIHEKLTGSAIQTIGSDQRDRVLDDIAEVLEEIEESTNIIIDPINPLERGESRIAYRNLLSQLTSTTIETESLAVLHTLAMDELPTFRETTLTLADVVWEVRVDAGRKEELELLTHIPKHRGGQAILENVKLDIRGPDVHTDDSRYI